jgi:hypothetical protein
MLPPSLSVLSRLLVPLVAVIVFGVFLPWMRGISFLDPVVTAAYACLGVLFAAPVVAQRFGHARPAGLAPALKIITKEVAYGELIAAAMLGAGFATVYFTHRLAWFPPDLGTIATTGLMGLVGSFAITTLSGWIALRFSAGAARAMMRLIFLGLLLMFFFRTRWLPDVAMEGTWICLGLAAISILALRRVLQKL